MKLHLLMPMAGAGTRFSRDGFDCPKPLLPLWGQPFFFWAVQSVLRFQPLASLTFVILQEHARRFGLDREILARYPDARIIQLDHVLDGAVLTALEGVRSLPEDSLPILMNDCDQCFTAPAFYQFFNSAVNLPDGMLLSFPSSDPKYGYLICDDQNRVLSTVEKQAVSRHAICGAYGFRNREVFLQAAQTYLTECQYREFYLSGVFNVLLRQGKTVLRFPTERHVPFGTPEEYQRARELICSEVWR